MDPYFEDIRGVVQDVLSSPERVDVLVWMLCDERATSQQVDYALDVLRHRTVGNLNVAQLVRFFVEGAPFLEERVRALPEIHNLLGDQHVRDWCSGLAWQLVVCEGNINLLGVPNGTGNWLSHVPAESIHWTGLGAVNAVQDTFELSCSLHSGVEEEESTMPITEFYRQCFVGSRIWPGLSAHLDVRHDWLESSDRV